MFILRTDHPPAPLPSLPIIPLRLHKTPVQTQIMSDAVLPPAFAAFVKRVRESNISVDLIECEAFDWRREDCLSDE